MNSRERVFTALDHNKTDRLPMNYQGVPEITEALIRKTGVNNKEELLQLFGIDFRRIGGYMLHYIPPSKLDGEGYRRNMWGVRYKDEDGGEQSASAIPPFNSETNMDDILAFPWPTADALDFSWIKDECMKYKDTYVVYGSPWAPFFHEAGWMVGQENFFVWMHTKPDLIRKIIDKIVDYEIAATRKYLEASDGMIDITYFGNDFGTQRGLFISPEFFLKFIREPLKRFYNVSRDFGCRVMQHSCGSIESIIPGLVEDGVTIIDPIQVGASGMKLANLKSNFGSSITFHGGIDTQKLLPYGTVHEVRKEIKKLRKLFLESGGYIINGSQEYMTDIPLDNVLAIYDENKKCS